MRGFVASGAIVVVAYAVGEDVHPRANVPG